ncbi:hypothetical protein FZEAL_3591 [Fusarium zealandicum]|uniref:Uncharacterized protein n=1 Tax=Fusarium zealandicum TaxID=1053134 RepID=A0A8H4UNG4_9HYPO|nr:hypothetical protein FZEAL_3591 [Fusarium zealandicum]
MDVNKDPAIPITSSFSARALQTSVASHPPRSIMIHDDYLNAWEEPSQYPRIPNVYEPIDDNNNVGQLDRKETRGLFDSHEDWSITAQLGSSYTWSDDYNHQKAPKRTPTERQSSPRAEQSDEQRRAKRQSSFERWRNAGDKLFCNTNKLRS